MNAGKVCKVGARTALTDYFINKGAINQATEIIDREALTTAHDRLKVMLRDTYGVDREIINSRSTAPRLQFNQEVLSEINKLAGRYDLEGGEYSRDMNNDATLTPVDMVHKYVTTNNTPLGLALKYPTNFTVDQLGKFKVGMRSIYPEIIVKAVPVRMVSGVPRYAVSFEQAASPVVTPLINDEPGSPADLYNTREMELVTQAIEPLLKKFKGVTVNWVTREEMKEMLKGKKPKIVSSKGDVITGVAIGKEVYLVQGMVTPATAIEEFLHLFVDTLYTQRKALYLGLLRQAQENYPALGVIVNTNYSDENGFSQDDRDRELITKALRDAYIRERQLNPEGVTPGNFLTTIGKEFMRLAKEFFKWVGEKVAAALELPIETIPMDITISDLATYLNITGVEVPLLEATDYRFSVEPGEQKSGEFDDEHLLEANAVQERISVKDLKRDRAAVQAQRLVDLHDKLKAENNPATAGIRKTLRSLVTLTNNYVTEVLDKDVKTVSVTKFAGSPVFDPRFKKAAEASIGYGLFLHEFMEKLMIDALEKNVTIGEFIRNNPNYFENFYNEEILIEDGTTVPRHKKYLMYQGMTMKQIKEDIMKVVDIVAADSIKGVIIPEITIYGTDSMGRIIDGRLDYIIIHKDGRIEPKDFKTHKSNSYMKYYSDRPLGTKYATKRLLDGVYPKFEFIPGRTKYSDYLAQVSIYARILKQQGFQSEPGSIISAIYYPEPNEEEFVYAGAHVAEVPIVGTLGMMMNRDTNGNPTAEVDPRYERIMDIIAEAFPIEGETSTAEAEEQEVVDRLENIRLLSPETIESLFSNLADAITTQLTNINKEISEAERTRADETKIKILKDRRSLLREANSLVLTDKFKDEIRNNREISPELLLKGLIEKSIEIVNKLQTESKAIKDNANLSTEEKIKQLTSRHAQLADYMTFLKAFDNILIANNIGADTLIRQEVGDVMRKIQQGQQQYIDVAKDHMINLLLKVNRKLAERMMESMRMYFGFRKQRLEKIAAGDDSILNTTTFWLGGKINKVFNAVTSIVSSSPKKITADMKEAAQEELKKIEFWEKNQKYDRSFVEMYVNNTFNNPESGFYIGSTITPREANWNGDDFVASFGNSELAIAAMASYGIQMNEQAKDQFFMEMEKLSIDQLYQNMTQKYGSYEAAVAAISQEVDMEEYRDGTMKKYRMYMTPWLMDYFKKYDELDYAIYSVKKQIEETEKDSSLSEEDKANKLAVLKVQLDKANLESREWYLENSETKLKEEVYRLEVQLPTEIQDKINELQDRISTLLNPIDTSDVNLQESIVEEVQGLEFQISKLRKEAIAKDPSLIDVFEKYDKYYEYHVNEGGFNYRKNWMIRNFGEDSPQYKAWLKRNADFVPPPSWYKRYYELLEQKASMFEEDPVYEDLKNRRNELMKKYKFKSQFSVNMVFNPMMMSEEDYQSLTDIDEAIEEYFATKPKVRLSKAEREELDNINAEIQQMSGRENKPSYVNQFTDMKNELINMRAEIAQLSQDPARVTELNQLKVQFANKELLFKQWYDRNNKSTYEIGTIDRQGSVSMDPRKFNQIVVPSDNSLLVMVPSSRWRSRSRKPEAYNPNYSPTLRKRRYGMGSYPMPKGIKYVKDKDGVGKGRYEVDPKSKWVNPRYAAMMKDPEGMKFYNTIVMDLYINKQVGMSAQKLEHFYPSVTQPGFESVAQDGFTGLKREWTELVQNIRLYDSAIEQDVNEFGTAGNARVRFPHNSLWTADLTTKDGLNAVLKWNLSYNINQSMEEANLLMSPAIDYLRSMKDQIVERNEKDRELRIKQIEKVIDIWEFERNKFIYGQTMEAAIGNIKSNIANRKMLRNLMSIVSFGRLGFDPVMQVGNLISGNVQEYLAGEVERNGHGGTKDLAWAKAQMYVTDGFFYKLIANWGEISGVNRETKILRYFNPTMRDYDRLLDSTGRGKMRRALMRGFNLKDIAFIIQDKGELEIGVTTLLKNLNAHKYAVYATDVNGNFILDDRGNRTFKRDRDGNIEMVSAYDALIDGPGSLPTIRHDVAMEMEDLEAIKFRTYNEYLKFQGNYSTYMKPRIESSIMGTLMTFFRKYLVPAVENRFKGAFGVGDPKNWTSGDIAVGWWTAMGQIFKYGEAGAGVEAILPGFIAKAVGMKKLDVFYKTKAMQARREVLVATIMAVSYVMLRSLLFGDDDDEKEVGWAGLQAMRIMGKVANESRSLVAVPGIGKADDYITNFSTYTTAFNEMKMLNSLLLNTFWYTTGGLFDWEYAKEMGLYQRKEGAYEKGDPKALANFLKITGIENIMDFIAPEPAAKKMYKQKL